MVSWPQQLTVPWSGAPSPGTTCSLELSLPSPAGIWFKTLLPVGGANTVKLPPKGELVSQHPGVRLLMTSEAGSVGVANGRSDRRIPTKPVGGLLSDLGTGGPCLRLTGHTIPDCPESVLCPSLGPCCPSASKLQARTAIPLLTAGVEPTPRGRGKGNEDNTPGNTRVRKHPRELSLLSVGIICESTEDPHPRCEGSCAISVTRGFESLQDQLTSC